MTDRELLEMAAKAAGIGLLWSSEKSASPREANSLYVWNPLTSDGDALRLAVKLNLSMRFDSHPDGVEVSVYGEWDDAPAGAQETYERDGTAATRRAIVRAAAEIGRQMS